MNEKCQCESAGFCQRHQVEKNIRQFDLCRGVNCTMDQCARYWNHWEKIRAKPEFITPPKPVPTNGGVVHQKGPGSALSDILKGWGFDHSSNCNCGEHAAQMDSWGPEECERRTEEITGWLIEEAKERGIPFVDSAAGRTFARRLVKSAVIKSLRSPQAPAEIPEREITKRNVIMHIWPVKHHGGWQWNCDQLMRRADLFNGRRVIAIAKDSKADKPEVVQEYLRDFTDEFIVLRNNPKRREVASFLPLMEAVQSVAVDEATFYCHSKGVRRNVAPDDPSWTVFKWTEAMYRTCLDHWETTGTLLRSSAMAGSFRRNGIMHFPGNHGWHYSGTFYWFRHADVFCSSRWRELDPTPEYAVEFWPGRMFRHDQVACIFEDDCGNPYDREYWDGVAQRLKQWSAVHESFQVK